MWPVISSKAASPDVVSGCGACYASLMESFVTVELVPGIVLPRQALRFTFSRGSGPGGQNVNKVNARVQLKVAMSAIEAAIGPEAAARLRARAASRITESDDLLLTAEDSRSQHTNRRTCLSRLGALLVEAQREPRVRKPTRPGRAAQQRRIESKTHRSRIKQMRKKPLDPD